MYSFQASHSGTQRGPVEQRAFQRVSVNLEGRLMLANYDEFVCRVINMSPGDVRFACAGRPRPGERVIAYIDHLGRIEGSTVKLTDDGFVMTINATGRKREKLAAQLTWIANKHELGLPEDRRHDRLTPRQVRTQLTLEDGTVVACRLMDLSLSGAAVDTDLRPPLGTAVRVGSMRGRVVRHFVEGIAVEFLSLQSREALTEFL